MLSRHGALVALLLASAAPLAAQDVPVLRGTLRDSLGRPMPRVEVSYKRVTTLTDEAGAFRLTPVPLGRIVVRFVRDGIFIGDLEANVTSDTLPTVAVEVFNGREEPRSLFGVVVDSTGAPMKNVTVEVVTAMLETRTDSLGRFRFPGLPARRHFVRVRRVGYSPTFAAVDLTDSVPRIARIVLRQYAGQNLGLVVVKADRVPARLRGFLQRAERRSGWGRILTADDIAKRNPQRASDLLQGMAGVRVGLDRRGQAVLTGRGGCVLALFINGFPAPQRTNSGIDDLMNVIDLVGVEVYNGIAGVPMELTSGPPNQCGTIGLWTK